MRVRDKTGARQRAKEAGLTLYFTGIPCLKAGHICERMVSTAACVECNRENRRRWAAENPGANMAWAKRNPEKMKAINNAFYANHKEARRANTKRCREANADYYKEYKKRWLRDNRAKVLANVRNRKAKIRAAPGKHSAEDIKELLTAQKGKCAYCRVKLKTKGFHVDHIIPIAKGGRNDRVNLQLTCEGCNLSKNAKHPIEFAQSRGLLL